MSNSNTQTYFYIYDDGSGSYPVAQIQDIQAKLKAGLIAEGEPQYFSLLGSDGITYNFTNNGFTNWNNYNPSAPITPQPNPSPLTPATPIAPKPNNNSKSSSDDSLYLIVGVAIIGIYLKYKLT